MKLAWSRQAIEDRKAIFRYIDQWDAQAAVKVSLRIREACNRLQRFPHIGRKGRVDATQELVISGTPYIAAYKIDADDILILRVLHSAMQWPLAFKDEQSSEA